MQNSTFRREKFEKTPSYSATFKLTSFSDRSAQSPFQICVFSQARSICAQSENNVQDHIFYTKKQNGYKLKQNHFTLTFDLSNNTNKRDFVGSHIERSPW